MTDSPNDEVLHAFNRSQDAIAEQDWRTATEHLQQCLQLAPEDTPQQRAFKAMVAFHLAKCLTYLHGREAVAHDPELSVNIRQLFRDVCRLATSVSDEDERVFEETYPGALTESHEGAVTDPLLKGETLYTLGLRAIANGDMTDAVELFLKALTFLDDADELQHELIAEAHLRLAALYSESGQIEKSAEHARWLLANDPTLSREQIAKALETLMDED